MIKLTPPEYLNINDEILKITKSLKEPSCSKDNEYYDKMKQATKEKYKFKFENGRWI